MRVVDLDPILALLATHTVIIDAPEISQAICDDPVDDKSLACAVVERFL